MKDPGVDSWRSRMIAGLLVGQEADGSFGVHPYRKWTGAHWRLVSLVELGVPLGHMDSLRAMEGVLAWIGGQSIPRIVSGRERRHASMEGNALFVCCRLGLADDDSVSSLVDTLLRSQWPDGGWNCDKRPATSHSSFHESVTPIRGLAAYHSATDDVTAMAAARRGAELLLSHRLFRRSSSGEVIHPEFLHIHWPPYWHYDFFIGLRAVDEAGLLHDPRVNDALDRLIALKRGDSAWRASGHRYWRPPGSLSKSGVEAVDWGDASPIVTDLAKGLLRAAGRT